MLQRVMDKVVMLSGSLGVCAFKSSTIAYFLGILSLHSTLSMPMCSYLHRDTPRS